MKTLVRQVCKSQINNAAEKENKSLVTGKFNAPDWTGESE